ncbi:17-beta-hydroxysteroid dehydrogenase type 6 isoform X1 [Microcaecilia unicolor]|uniref:17-beta-hydroxysteroid dehydrogenase type 6-like isoform X1 n=1 Tax=Microcaecilia unicolor TaxID=1415580 RepID=A0A6P7XF35_9AMPH|nr:17-beta-hydroxysteroid dehydrogenase type 6-like isoform X1 [Microcaecilia unicolor]XP_030051092.1 17-beta-hydroxysteroid dehydrogenase type 6-like isoform X1 [Microcaecilia unicolor]XP_030051093.1 17-beta-hydroxysteroid dehydrogenase type 6-like isoform X1 [Microcaecilia unicolor]
MWFWLFALIGFYFLYRWCRDKQIHQNLTDKYVFITGCDSGFGNLLARQLDGRGLRVLAACLTQRGAEQLKEATSQRLQTIILDVTDSESVASAAKWVKQQVGDRGLWGLVNNAGIGTPVGPNEWLTKDDFVKVLNVNLVGVIDVTLSLLSLLRRAKGRIVNVSSILGRVACTGGGYCISKHGVEAFSDSLRRDLRPFGVKVAIIEPSMFRTSISDAQIIEQSFQHSWNQIPVEIRETYGQQYFEKRSKNIIHALSRASSDLSLVTDCMAHALTAVHPHTRYSVGWTAKLFYIPISYLPTELADFLLTRSAPKPANRA